MTYEDFMDENKTFDVLIYHDNTSTSIIHVTSVVDAINQYIEFMGEKAIDDITDVYVFNRGNNDPEHRIKIEDWRNAE